MIKTDLNNKRTAKAHVERLRQEETLEECKHITFSLPEDSLRSSEGFLEVLNFVSKPVSNLAKSIIYGTTLCEYVDC